MRTEFIFKVVVTYPDDHLERFEVTRETLAPEVKDVLEEALDGWTSNAADETWDDDGRIALLTEVIDITPDEET